jgi:hypothetical protein
MSATPIGPLRSVPDCSAALLPASSAQVCLACCSGRDFSAAWRASKLLQGDLAEA